MVVRIGEVGDLGLGLKRGRRRSRRKYQQQAHTKKNTRSIALAAQWLEDLERGDGTIQAGRGIPEWVCSSAHQPSLANVSPAPFCTPEPTMPRPVSALLSPASSTTASPLPSLPPKPPPSPPSLQPIPWVALYKDPQGILTSMHTVSLGAQSEPSTPSLPQPAASRWYGMSAKSILRGPSEAVERRNSVAARVWDAARGHRRTVFRFGRLRG